ncbi:hypothetical protein RIF25_06675 [Thermosynechococcaceae cyanobacterium BACA0444]|uniref:HPr kinase n=1 Tax=Pseudocalidococcus azoricus BACA0444 TaxID=2918990 RepID=A0AAE4FQU6_9CYAN|nr:hypothetical protein [Pseudocalidococcus azoricus]MDS3860491.1 hypothetical protein [Pseudocalidococcus azoricus BACA0444]
MYFYTAYHLNIASELALPELLPTQAPPDITIKYAPVQHPIQELAARPRTYSAPDSPDLFHFYPNVGLFQIHQAREIWLDPLPEAQEDLIRAFLLGPVFGALLYVRGHLVLHASCVVMGSGAVAFMGASGQGKSTLTSFLYQRGYSLVADDKVLVQPSPAGPPVVIPGYPHIRLWPDTVSALGFSLNRLPNLFTGITKKIHRLEAGFCQEAVPLTALYVLTAADTVSIEPLLGQNAFFELTCHRYIAPAIPVLGENPTQFRLIGQVLQQIPLYRLNRPRQFEYMEEVIQGLEARHY